ncbi:MAG: hypothetical protein O7F73_03305 [Gammaproteobacteria bacterium]|nr:hypothetical protein [Gammaproteobacteria bacterium]
MKLAVIGSGAAAHAVLAEIRRRQPGATVDVYDAAEPESACAVPTDPEHYNAVYRTLKQREGLSFPPPKSHFGTAVDSRPQAQMENNWQRPGGLTNYWGATCLPFSDEDLRLLGLSREQLDPYYERVAGLLKIAGDANSKLALRHQHRFIQAAPVRRLPLFEKLDAAVNDPASQRFVAGSNCVALDTAPESPTSCTYCGHCLAGCYRQALFCSASDTARAQQPETIRYRKALVERIDLDSRQIVLQGRGQAQRSEPYDRIFLAAGCVQSTAIALRSTGLSQAVTLYDNAIVQFPIVYTGRGVPGSKNYFALSQSLITCSESGSLIQVYPFADHLLRTAVPELLWPALRPLVSLLRARLLIGRLYLHSDHSHQYRMKLQAGDVAMTKTREPDQASAQPIIAALATLLKPGGFRVLGALTSGTRTSSHFASTLVDAAGVSPQSGRLAEHVYCCDAAMFRMSPALSPTFSIMANATRIAEAAL